jgi:hypothetical protein
MITITDKTTIPELEAALPEDISFSAFFAPVIKRWFVGATSAGRCETGQGTSLLEAIQIVATKFTTPEVPQ